MRLGRGHVSDDDLTLMSGDELPFTQRTRAERHMAACSRCRRRRELFEATLAGVRALVDRSLEDRPPDPSQRERLLAGLARMASEPEDLVIDRPQPLRLSGLVTRMLIPMNPILATALVLAVASLTCIFVWMQQMRPDITSNALLVRAEAWDPIVSVPIEPGVVRQTVTIHSTQQSLERTIYRDAQGRRPLRRQLLSQNEERLRRRLETASVAWDSPLSARGYQVWHDGQRVRSDNIERARGHLLVLTTTTPLGQVSAQSLTVRETDFHPVRRTISFRDKETVEIAEVDYSVLPWTPEISSQFHLEDDARLESPARPPVSAAAAAPPLLSEEQLDEVELSARLTLDHLHADNGEQIEVVRSGHGVEVRGITDSEARRQQLAAELEMLPHVRASITSIEQLKTRPAGGAALSGVRVDEMQTATTPLESYYRARGHGAVPPGDLAQRLFNSAFQVTLESRAIDDLQRRFGGREDISPIASATLADLIFTRKHNLLAALAEERRLLVEAGIGSPGPETPATGGAAPLARLAEQNLDLTRELVLGQEGGQERAQGGRPAETIAAELARSIGRLELGAHGIQVLSRDAAGRSRPDATAPEIEDRPDTPDNRLDKRK